MRYTLGIDIGTTGVKALVVDEGGRVAGSGACEYPLLVPRPNWAEQDPEEWWRATGAAVADALAAAGLEGKALSGLGLTGQMHGSVFLDKDHNVIRPAILWCDQRTAAECREITERVGADRLLEQACNPALTGFTAPKILWLRNHEPEGYQRVRRVLLPKDYIRFRLSGEFATEVSDASGTLLLDVAGRRWSRELLSALEIDPEWLPPCFESTVASTRVSETGAGATGLPEGLPIVGGGGDQAAGAVGTGIVETGVVSSTIGTSGVVFAHTDRPLRDPAGRLHTFCHAVPGKWHVMGVTLAAGGSLRWYRDTFCRDEVETARARGVDPYELITAGAETAEPGCEGLIFLPYISGERTPYPDPDARGVFFGISVRHTRAHFGRAVMEGVAMSLADCMRIMDDIGVPIREVRASGGGGRSRLWRQIQADVFGRPVSTINTQEGAAFGAALLAAVGVGVFPDVPSACHATIRVVETACPNAASRARYREFHALYRSLYPALRDSFAKVGSMVADVPSTHREEGEP